MNALRSRRIQLSRTEPRPSYRRDQASSGFGSFFSPRTLSIAAGLTLFLAATAAWVGWEKISPPVNPPVSTQGKKFSTATAAASNTTGTTGAPSRGSSGASAAPAMTGMTGEAQAKGAAPSPPERVEPSTTPDSAPTTPVVTAPVVKPTTAAQALNSPSLWGQPFVGYSLSEIVHELSPKYGYRTPKVWSEKMQGITSALPVDARNATPVFALTLDACDGKGDSAYDAGLIEFLRERKIPATLFVTSIWAKNNPQILKELANDPLFEIAAHGSRHKPCSVNGKEVYGIKGTASLSELVDEVEGNARDLQRLTGKRPRWFRSGTAYYDDVAVGVIHELGLGIAGYSISADEGASLAAAKVKSKALTAKNGDILLAHMNHPASGTREGLKEALAQLKEKGCIFVRLSGE